jgi:predicted lipid-binding transport protein (Tim44 family)
MRNALRGLGSVALLAVADAAFGRAGGGSHAAGGSAPSISGSHVSGSGGGGGSLGGILFLIVLVLVIHFVYRRMRRGGGDGAAGGSGAGDVLGAVIGAAVGGQLAAAPGARPAGDRPGLPAAVEAIRKLDPGFELESFMQRAEMAFFLVKRGMQRTDAAAVRPYLADPLFAQLSQSLQQMQSQHRHELLESLNVRAVHLTAATADAERQTLRVHFDLVYRAKTIDDANHVVQDEGADHRHGECWTFSRAASARTPAAGGVTAALCPACGAELRLALDGTCTHCRASVTNGSVDWVVSAVEPAPFVGYSSESQFALSSATAAEGIASLRAADPAFDATAFFARVRTAFMTLEDAWCRQQLDAGRAFLSPGAYFAWSAQLETLAAEGRRNVMEHLTVNAVTPLRVVHGRVFDDLTVRISAASADYEVDKDGRVVFGDRTVRPFVEEWTFQRSVGTTTSGKPGTLENQCPRCGAPLALTQIGECRYCKAAVTSGKFDWVVSRIEQEDDSEGGGDDAGGLEGQLVAAVGGAIVGGLLSSILSGDNSR